MRISKITFTLSLAALICVSSAAIAHADAITFTGTRFFPAGFPPATPNPARCGSGFPLVLTSPHLGTGNSNLGSFTSTESHCVNVLTGNVSNGEFTFDFGGGNAFFASYVGTIAGAPLPPPPPGVADVSFTYTLTGGTGIFSGATGSLIGNGIIIFTPSGTTSLISITGTVNTVIPEPATFLLLLTGFAGLGATVRKRRKPSD
jgi:hypothetical protein